jgi:UDP-N-acetylmuramate--alanine ligase
LALIARQAGYEVSGSDKQASSYTEQLQKQGVELYIGQSQKNIAAAHSRKPIDWLVYSSALVAENADHPELVFARAMGIKHTKRDELLNLIITDHHLKLVGVAGTHGKSTTTAMVIWLFHQLKIPISYSVGAKIPFGPMGQFLADSQFFVYECDEFDRNFLAFHPYLSLITGIGWDHQEIFPTRGDYNQAFADFISQSKWTMLWREDGNQLALQPSDHLSVLEEDDAQIARIVLAGLQNRQDAWQAVRAVHELTDQTIEELIKQVNLFPGLKQRMEKLAEGLYTNYAHTPEKIIGGMNTALEIAAQTKQDVVVIYEPLTNRRQHAIRKDYENCFKGAKKLYWVPTYLAREDPNLPILSPQELIKDLSDPSIAEPAALDDNLLKTISQHLKAGDMVVAMGASGAGSLDEWLRGKFQN